MRNKYIVTGALASMLLFSQLNESNAASKFSDIPGTYHANTQIEYLVKDGVISGFGDGTFRPEIVVTRGQFAAFVARALKLESSKVTFKDVPASSSLYKEINKAATAGIIKGFADGTFKPNVPVSRSDIAVMLDRALQSKGSYTKTVSLPYSDAKSIGAYAIESVKRMAAYGIMGPVGKTNKFQASTSGTRVSTVVSIYNMLQATTNNNSAPPPVINKKDSEMTLSELTQKYGEHRYAFRSRATHEVTERNHLEEYLNYVSYSSEEMTFTEFLSTEKQGIMSEYELFYPNFEILHYNGKSYKDSIIYNGEPDYMDFHTLLSSNPNNKGEYRADIYLNSKGVGVYLHDNVLIRNLKNQSYETGNKDVMVEVKTLFSDLLNITTSGNKMTIKNASSTLELTADSTGAKINGQSHQLHNKVVLKNGEFLVPIKEIAALLGLNTRVYTGIDVYKPGKIQRIEIANYQLAEDYTLAE